MALGLSLLFGVMGLMNFAYGELIMAGGYTMFYTRGWGWLGMVAMTLLLKRTTLGIQLRASTEDFRMAQLVGVRANWVISAAFGITGLLASAVAVLYVLKIGPTIAPDMGQDVLFVAFVGGVIGGLG